VLVIAGKALARHHADLSELLWETLTSARFDELPGCGNWSRKSAPSARSPLPTTATLLALAAASAGLSPVAALNHRWDGLHGLKQLKALDDALDNPEALRAFAERLARLRDRLQHTLGNYWSSARPNGRTSSPRRWPPAGGMVRPRWNRSRSPRRNRDRRDRGFGSTPRSISAPRLTPPSRRTIPMHRRYRYWAISCATAICTGPSANRVAPTAVVRAITR